MSEIEVRPFSRPEEYEAMIDYFLLADHTYLVGMGVDPQKLPSRSDWLAHVLADHQADDAHRDRFYLAWLYRGRLIGHSSINQIEIGESAYIHLHVWVPELRRSGLGVEFMRKSISFYFERFHLKRLYCEPYAENAGPNRTLVKLGFSFLKRYRTTPGATSFEQDVNQYVLEAPRSQG